MLTQHKLLSRALAAALAATWALGVSARGRADTRSADRPAGEPPSLDPSVADPSVADPSVADPSAGAEAEDDEDEAPAKPKPKPTRAPLPASHERSAHERYAREAGMVRVPGGAFTMGTSDPKAPPNERPPLPATVAPFWIDVTEVTVGAYRACVDRGACAAPARSSASCTFAKNDPALPVSCVSFAAAEVFCRAEKKRLPTEAEWEFAARGASLAVYPWGARSDGRGRARASCALAVTLIKDVTAQSCSGLLPARVGSRPQGMSPFGVLDMSGNLEEWVSDLYVEVRASAVPPRVGASHPLRGGGWLSPPSRSRTTTRNWGSALEAGPNVGFRCARTA